MSLTVTISLIDLINKARKSYFEALQRERERERPIATEKKYWTMSRLSWRGQIFQLVRKVLKSTSQTDSSTSNYSKNEKKSHFLLKSWFSQAFQDNRYFNLFGQISIYHILLKLRIFHDFKPLNISDFLSKHDTWGLLTWRLHF